MRREPDRFADGRMNLWIKTFVTSPCQLVGFFCVVVVLRPSDEVGFVFVLAEGSYVLSFPQPEAGTPKYRMERVAKCGPHH